MTWKRVLTALVLIPVVVAIVLFTSTAVVAVATAVITILALWEYFALGDAIGHRAYRLWTILCSLFLLFLQWDSIPIKHPGEGVDWTLYGGGNFPRHDTPFTLLGIFVFVLGVSALTLWTKRPLVESLPAAGITSSALLLVAFPHSPLRFASMAFHLAVPAFSSSRSLSLGPRTPPPTSSAAPSANIPSRHTSPQRKPGKAPSAA